MLTKEDFEEIVTTKKTFYCPDQSGIKVGDKVYLRTKIGGEMQLAEVIIKRAPYHPDNRKYLYVDVFGYGIRESVNVTKLLIYGVPPCS